ncbi:hypothetical protein JW823_04095 [bacterium]|nr:hypothetical protein [candidate division CSSED10-310 bacterium]
MIESNPNPSEKPVHAIRDQPDLQNEADDPVPVCILQYGKDIRNRFKTLIGILGFIAILSYLFEILHSGWFILIIIGLFILIAYYRYRICRTIRISGKGVAESVAGRDWFWTFEEIVRITETSASRSGSEPSKRLVMEHASSLDIAIDNQMMGYEDAFTMIRRYWILGLKRKLSRNSIPFFLLKYW